MLPQFLKMVIGQRLNTAAPAANQVMVGIIAYQFIDAGAAYFSLGDKLEFAEKIKYPVNGGTVNRRNFFLNQF